MQMISQPTRAPHNIEIDVMFLVPNFYAKQPVNVAIPAEKRIKAKINSFPTLFGLIIKIIILKIINFSGK